MPRDAESSDERYREWMYGNLSHAARHFNATITSTPVFGWRLRSIGAAVEHSIGRLWLRVVSEYTEWASGDIWTGNVDARAITGINKPEVLDVVEWDDEDWRRQRAELSTYLSTPPCSATDVLRQDLELPQHWWAELRRTADRLSTIETSRWCASQNRVTQRIKQAFGDDVDSTVSQWETVHGDLHWANLLAPTFGLLDWELWGRGPVATDAATLFCSSLLVPTVAHTVHEVFADKLDTPAGHTAQTYVAARLLNRTEQGDHPDLVEPLRQHIQTLSEQAR